MRMALEIALLRGRRRASQRRAHGHTADAHLGTVLDDTGAESLTELVKKHRKNK
jgi:hypothetical protein